MLTEKIDFIKLTKILSLKEIYYMWRLRLGCFYRGVRHETKQRTRFLIFGIFAKDSR